MVVYVVLRDWEENIEEYATHHNNEFHGVFATEALAQSYIDAIPNRNWETNNYVVQKWEVASK